MDGKDNKILELITKEKFLAFFDVKKMGETGESVLDGLCKVACPVDNDTFNYISVTSIFDTPSESALLNAKRIISKLTAEEIIRYIPDAYAITSLAAPKQQPQSYVHQIDIIFKNRLPSDKRELVNKIVYALRNAALLNTETPQFWDEETAPEASEAEKSNWSARLKAFLGIQ